MILASEMQQDKDESDIEYLDHGLNFLCSAKVLNENLEKLGSHRYASVYFCIAHSYELLLKAFLLNVGLTKSEITKPDVRHNLEALIEIAKSKGFRIVYDDEYEIAELNKYIAKHEFRYPIMGDKFLTDTEGLIDIGFRIHSNIQDFIKEKNTEKDAA